MHVHVRVQVYRHEGAKGKSELRCHAAFCGKETEAKVLEARLKQTLATTLKEYYKEQKRKETQRITHAGRSVDKLAAKYRPFVSA